MKKETTIGFIVWSVIAITSIALINFCGNDDSETVKDITSGSFVSQQEVYLDYNQRQPDRTVEQKTVSTAQVMDKLERDLRKKASSIVHTFKSISNDREGRHIGEKNERFDVVTYHQFDFGKTIVTQYIVGNGEYEKLEYPFNSTDVGNDGMGYITIKMNQNGVKEIWFHEGGKNLGYDYNNGLRWSYYDLTAIK